MQNIPNWRDLALLIISLGLILTITGLSLWRLLG